MLFKTCTKCNIEQNLDCFAQKKAGKYGVASECRACANERFKTHYKEYKDNYTKPTKEDRYLASRKYRQNNLDKVYANNARYRYSMRGATPSWVDKEAIAGMYQLAAIFNSTGINLHVDHIVPLKSSKVCGLHTEDNLRLLPATENITKGNRYWDDMWTTA